MKTVIILFGPLLITLASLINVCAQHVVPGITAGASLNSMDLKSATGTSSDLSNVNGFEAGLFLSFSTHSFYVRPMAVASFLRGNVNTTVDGIKTDESKFNLTTLETPVLVGLKILPGFSIEAGPSWNYIMSYTEEINGVYLDLSRNTLGYRGGIRLTFSRLGAFAHYGGVINTSGDSDYELKRPSRIVFGATFDLVSGK